MKEQAAQLFPFFLNLFYFYIICWREDRQAQEKKSSDKSFDPEEETYFIFLNPFLKPLHLVNVNT